MLKLFVGDPKRGGLAVARATALIIHRIITIITITVSHPLSLSLSISLSLPFSSFLHLAGARKEYIYGLTPRHAIYTFHDAYYLRVFVKRRLA